MPYSKSKGRNDFETLSSDLFSLAREISFRRVKLSYEHKNLVYQSCIVLLSSAVEQYLKSFIEDLFYSYRSNGATLSQLPDNSRTFALFVKHRTVYESFINNRDETKALTKLNIKDPSYAIVDNSIILTNHVDPNKIVNDRKYPSIKNIKSLYNRIGIANIFSRANSIGRKDYELLLKSFLDIRETIAHQESQNLTFDDIKRNFKNISDLIDKLDRISYKEVCKMSGSKFWN